MRGVNLFARVGMDGYLLFLSNGCVFATDISTMSPEPEFRPQLGLRFLPHCEPRFNASCRRKCWLWSRRWCVNLNPDVW